jgi:sugar phosphate isomerase/epimerase
MNSPFPEQQLCTRRDFVLRTAKAGTMLAMMSPAALSRGAAPDEPQPKVVVFSKVYQTLKLNYEDAAAITAEAGLDGIDCPVRPDGEVEPERAHEDLPKYVAALRTHKLTMPLITSGITSVSSPSTQQVLRTAKTLDVQAYRLGFIKRASKDELEKQVREVKAALKELAGLNKEIGITGIFQNHSPSGNSSNLGGDLGELYELVKDLDPKGIGVAFDIGHALVVHGTSWREHFERLKPHIKIVYVKDVKSGARWVPFGEGEVGGSGYFKALRDMHYHAPVCMHIEYDWTNGGKEKTRPALVKALRESLGVLKGWLRA